jgi:acetyl-CoA carboxylase biotin carboxyl carrier protein
VDLKDIKAILDLMKKNSVSEFELEKQDFKIRLKRGVTGSAPAIQFDEAQPAISTATPVALPASAATATASSEVSSDMEIKSPMIGTFYRSPSPESGSYVEVGTEVNPDTVVCIIEAMKVMNEIKAEASGTIVRILAEDGKPVQYGQALYELK